MSYHLCEELCQQNKQMKETIVAQFNEIRILKEKLAERRTTILQEHLATLATNVTSGSENVSAKTELEKKIEEATNIFDLFQSERESLKRDFEQNERVYAGHISYLTGQLDHFRDVLFEQMKKINSLEKEFRAKFNVLKNAGAEIVQTAVENEKTKLREEFNAFSQIKPLLEEQQGAVSKLRSREKEVADLVHKLNEEITQLKEADAIKDAEINVLKSLVRRLADVFENLQAEFTLKLEECEADMIEFRSNLKLALESWTGHQFE